MLQKSEIRGQRLEAEGRKEGGVQGSDVESQKSDKLEEAKGSRYLGHENMFGKSLCLWL